MEWIGLMNKAVEFLEANITEKLEIEEVAKIALSSTFHFQRMYHIITGVTVVEYIRRRRLTLAAQDIISGEKVIDVAYKYGYETPEAFTKAFKKMHGITPSTARKPGANLKAYPRLSFHISIKGDKDVNYKIIERGSFKVIGKQRKITSKDEENLKLVPEFWDDCRKDGSYEWIRKNAGEMGVLGICMPLDSCGKEYFMYTIAGEKKEEDIPKGFVSMTIPAATWAVFESIGPMPGAMQDVIKRTFSEWMPSTGYQHDCAPEIEVYLIVGCVNEKIVTSCVIVIISNLTNAQRPYALIENVITDEKHRGKGYATSILNYAKELAEKENCYKIMLLTGSKKESTLNFYRNAGYNSDEKTGFIQRL